MSKKRAESCLRNSAIDRRGNSDHQAAEGREQRDVNAVGQGLRLVHADAEIGGRVEALDHTLHRAQQPDERVIVTARLIVRTFL